MEYATGVDERSIAALALEKVSAWRQVVGLPLGEIVDQGHNFGGLHEDEGIFFSERGEGGGAAGATKSDRQTQKPHMMPPSKKKGAAFKSTMMERGDRTKVEQGTHHAVLLGTKFQRAFRPG